MERSASMSPSTEFVRWQEAYVSSDKGRREIHYYLKRNDGTEDLAIVGKETSLRHMSYRYATRNRSIAKIAPSSSRFKLKYRREVIDWLNSVVSGSTPRRSSFPHVYPLDSTDGCELNANKFKDSQLRKLGHYTKEFLWLGSAWTCRKRRKHYESFRRNGVKISAQDFIFVLVEEDKRLVAYLEDMYEDSRGNKMVVVRWFHKSDEVGIVLPHNFNDREIFFSLCLQDLNIECIDGLATVLNPQHFKKFSNEAACTQFEPFVCCGKYENDEVKPFDITLVKGYWKQEILRYVTSTSNASVKPLPSVDDDFSLQYAGKRKSSDTAYAGGSEKRGLKNSCFPAPLASKDLNKEDPAQHLTVGMQVEVLSQDSGLRGCWFRATIIKKHKDLVKVRYRDLPDADDEAKSLEEWLLASCIAVPDGLGIRLWGRKTIRPSSQLNKSRVSWVIDAGSVVDVWWHDGWWEGIVIQKESDYKFHVYFPGENQKSIFGRGVLRHSQEWLRDSWEHLRERPDVVNSLSLGLEESNQVVDEQEGYKLAQAAMRDHGKVSGNINKDSLLVKGADGFDSSLLEAADDKGRKLGMVPDLQKDVLLAQLKWNTSKKRSLTQLEWDSSKKRKRASGISIEKPNDSIHNDANKPEVVGSRSYEGFFIPSSLNVDHDNCKYMGDSLFSSSVVPPFTSLVMSR